MKGFALFILFFLIGLSAIVGYSYLFQKNVISPPSISKITTKFSLANAPSESLKGNIASISGTVTWLSRTADNPVPLEASQTIQQGEEVSTGKNGKVAVVIQNSEGIILSPNSFINFIQLLPINLVLEQNSGVVSYQNTGQSAMSVQTLDLITGIDRGSAKISIDRSIGTVTITVDKGLVTEGYEDSDNNSNVVTVNAGQQFVFDDSTLTGTVEGKNVNTGNFLN